MFEVGVDIRNLAGPSGFALVETHLLVMELTTALSQIEVLVGLDLLLCCRFLLDGPVRQFSLEF